MRESKLTASVHLCDLSWAEPITNNAKLFDSRTVLKQLSPYPALADNKKLLFEQLFVGQCGMRESNSRLLLGKQSSYH